MKFCKDCRYCDWRPGPVAQQTAYCTHPTSTLHQPPDVVTGDTRPYQIQCYGARRDGFCGPDAHHFQPRETGEGGMLRVVP
ncbi:MAG: hypothetical protein FWD12_01515 [Alphaproteobacteria bacterium]|nr:hypothetical protein [Alphaproteobacteria bacterium]